MELDFPKARGTVFYRLSQQRLGIGFGDVSTRTPAQKAARIFGEQGLDVRPGIVPRQDPSVRHAASIEMSGIDLERRTKVVVAIDDRPAPRIGFRRLRRQD